MAEGLSWTISQAILEMPGLKTSKNMTMQALAKAQQKEHLLPFHSFESSWPNPSKKKQLTWNSNPAKFKLKYVLDFFKDWNG